VSGQRGDDQERVNDAESVAAVSGTEFAVTVADLPGAGYEWVAGAVPAGLTVVGEDWAEPVPSGVGASRRRTFHLRADRAGSYELVLELRRPWEHDEPPARTHTVLVTVAPSP
jgi:predicted secreted protein